MPHGVFVLYQGKKTVIGRGRKRLRLDPVELWDVRWLGAGYPKKEKTAVI